MRSASKSRRKRRARGERALATVLLEKIRAGDDVRLRKTRRIRGAVRAHRYESDLKLLIALEKLIPEL